MNHVLNFFSQWALCIKKCSNKRLEQIIRVQHQELALALAQTKSMYVDKWVSTTQSTIISLITFGKPQHLKCTNNTNFINLAMPNTCRLLLKIYLVSPSTHPNPNYTLCPNNKINTWPHLLSTCLNPHTKEFRKAYHNNAKQRTHSNCINTHDIMTSSTWKTETPDSNI